jgi:type I restriction enzyme S subunit
MKDGWKMVPLGELLARSEETVEIVPTEQYKEVTIRLWGKGVVLRGEVQGQEITATRRFGVKAGQFILSRIDARNGAFGIVPEFLDGAVASNDFPTYNIVESRMLTAYLGWMSRTQHFVDFCGAASEGTTNRVRLQESRFLATAIPLPPIPEQWRIVATVEDFAAKVEEATRLRGRAIGENTALEKASVDHVYHQQLKECGPTALAAVCTSLTDGDHLTPTFSEQGVPFIFVGNVSTGKLHFRDCKFVAEDYFKELSPLRKPSRGDILYSAVGATLGVPVVVDTDGEFCFQRHIAIIKPNRTKVLPDYMRHMLRSATVFDKAWQSTTGTAQPTIPLRGIRALEIPLPPLPEQRRIVAYLDDLQAKVDCMKALQVQTQAELDALLPSILDKAFKGEL